MTTLTSYIILALIGILIGGPYFKQAYQMPRDFVLCVSAFLLLCYGTVYGVSVYFSSTVLTIILLMFGWWFLCSVISLYPKLAIYDCICFMSVVVLCGVMSEKYLNLGVMLLTSAALLNCVYAIIQNKFRYEFLKRSTNTTHLYAVGFVGNQNMLASYLVPHIFMAMWLAQVVHPVWLLAVCVIVYTIRLTHCRTAYIGMLCGGTYLLGLHVGALTTFGIVAILILLFALLYCLDYVGLGHGGSATLYERLNYWEVALMQIWRTPILGLGFNVFQTNIPFLQKELNERTNGKFLDPANYECPYPQKCHNDYLQHILDNGFVGFGFICVMVYYALVNTHNILGAALVGLLGCGLSFHTFHIRVTNVMFWFLVFTLIRAGDFGTTPVTIHWFIPIAFGVLVFKFILTYIMGDYTFQKYFRSNGMIEPTGASRYMPNSSVIHTFAGQYELKKHAIPKLFEHAFMALAHTDGSQRLWELWNNLGLACFLGGSLTIARYCYEKALSFLPSYKSSKNGLQEIDKILMRVQGGDGVIGAQFITKKTK